MSLFTVKSKEGCPSCVAAKEMLASRGIEYVEERYDDYAERQAMYDRLGLVGGERTVPQIFYARDGETIRVGGFQNLGGFLEGLEIEQAFS